jgi:hypothetical protein
MAKRTLLELTKTILSDMSAGEVNSIMENEEASAVASIIKRTYYDLAVEYDLPTSSGLFQLTALGDTDRPTTFLLPDDIYHVEWIQYDYRLDLQDQQVRYTDISYISPEEFFNRNRLYNSEDSYVQTVTDISGVKLLVRNDTNPSYWTSFDNRHIVFDGYDSAIESTLQQSKVAAYGNKGMAWSQTNTFIPPLPDHLFPLLLSTAENRAFEFLKQTLSANIDKQERRSRRRIRVNENRVDRTRKAPNFGRK